MKPVHVMLRVAEEQRSVLFYSHALEMKVVDRFEFETFVLLYLQSPEKNFELELTVNSDRVVPYIAGDAYGHLAFVVDDLDAHHVRMCAAGFRAEPIKKLEKGGRLLARFFFVSDPDGYRIEIIQKMGRYV